MGSKRSSAIGDARKYGELNPHFQLPQRLALPGKNAGVNGRRNHFRTASNGSFR
jgi:hypothetical protein